MATEANYAGTAASDNSYGSHAWDENLSDAEGASDNSDAGTGLVIDTASTEYLKLTNFGFSIPAGATIDGIQVDLRRRTGGSGTQADDRARIVKGGTIGSTDKAAAGNWSSSYVTQTYGGAADLWGESWTSSDINASNFGFVISAALTVVGTPQVDSCQITVTYTEANPLGKPRTLSGVESYQYPSDLS